MGYLAHPKGIASQKGKRAMESGSETFVVSSERIVLVCGCGESIVLLGRKADWYSEGRTSFECGGCAKKLSLTSSEVGEESSMVAKGFPLAVLAP